MRLGCWGEHGGRECSCWLLVHTAPNPGRGILTGCLDPRGGGWGGRSALVPLRESNWKEVPHFEVSVSHHVSFPLESSLAGSPCAALVSSSSQVRGQEVRDLLAFFSGFAGQLCGRRK